MSNMQNITASAVAARKGVSTSAGFVALRAEALIQRLAADRVIADLLATIRPAMEAERDVVIAMREVGL